MQSSFSLDSVQLIYDFFKLLPLNLNAVAVTNEPVCMFVFFCQFPQFIFSNAEVARRFFYGQRVTLPYWNIFVAFFYKNHLTFLCIVLHMGYQFFPVYSA